MTENDRRLLQANAKAVKLLLDLSLRARVTMVDPDRARDLSDEIGAALASGAAVSAGVAVDQAPVAAAGPSPVGGWLAGWWMRRRLTA